MSIVAVVQCTKVTSAPNLRKYHHISPLSDCQPYQGCTPPLTQWQLGQAQPHHNRDKDEWKRMDGLMDKNVEAGV